MHRANANLALVVAFALSLVPVPGDASPGIPLAVQQTQNCSALTPRGWSVTGNAAGSTLETKSPNAAMYAGWGVLQVNRAMQPYYGAMYGDPQTSIQSIANAVLRANYGDAGGLRYTTAPRPFLNYFSIRGFASQRTRGTVFYHIYPADGPNYIESFYLAVNGAGVPRSQRDVALAVAVSIRCRTQLVSHASDSGSRGAKPNGCGGEGDLRGYDKELGWQYAHTGSGTNLLFDASDWRENGPQGAGYYATVGNALEKLELGRSDDC